MSDAAGLIVLAGRILFAVFFGWIAGVGHIRRSKMMEDYARSARFPERGERIRTSRPQAVDMALRTGDEVGTRSREAV